MKRCNICGTQNEEQANFCVSCGAADFSTNEQAVQNLHDQVQGQGYPPIYNPVYQVQNNESNDIDINDSGNILAGIVGAFLFSIIGGLLYFLIYQVGIIAGICGLIIFVLANFGYGLFAKTKNKASVVGLISTIVVTIIMIFVSEYVSLSFEIFQVYKDSGITIFDAIRATPEFLSNPEIGEAVASDLTFAYIFGFIATIGNVVSIVKARKKQ